MTEQENKQIVQDAYAAFGRGDVKGILNQLSDNVEWFLPGSPEILPAAGRRQGHEQVAQFFSTIDETMEFANFTPEEFIAQGDKVVVIGRSSGRIKTTGKPIESDWVHVHTVRDGKIVSFREYYDTAAFNEAFSGPATQAAQAT